MAIEYCTDPEYFEYLDGQVYPKVSPLTRHTLVQGSLVRLVYRLASGRGFSGPEWRFRLGAIDGTDTALQPDLAFISEERLRALPARDREEPPVAPDIAVEIRSPSYRKGLLARKIARYLGCGSILVLDVDPAKRRIDAHTHDGVRRYENGERFGHPAIPWLIFEVSEIFTDLDRLA